MNRTDLIRELRDAAADPETPPEVAATLLRAAMGLEGLEVVTFQGAPVVEGSGEGPTLSQIFGDLGLPPARLDHKIKGYQAQSVRNWPKEIAKARRLFRFEERDPKLEVRFFDHYEDAQEFAGTLKYSIIAYDPESAKWSVDELGANYGC